MVRLALYVLASSFPDVSLQDLRFNHLGRSANNYWRRLDVQCFFLGRGVAEGNKSNGIFTKGKEFTGFAICPPSTSQIHADRSHFQALYTL